MSSLSSGVHTEIPRYTDTHTRPDCQAPNRLGSLRMQRLKTEGRRK